MRLILAKTWTTYTAEVETIQCMHMHYACIIVYMYIHAVAIEQNTTCTGTSP